MVEAAGHDRMARPESDVAGFGWHVMEEDVLDEHAFPTQDAVSGLALRFEKVLQRGRQVEDATLERVPREST